MLVANRAFHAHTSAAPLKPGIGIDKLTALLNLPRSHERGSVEARAVRMQDAREDLPSTLTRARLR